MNPHPVGPPPGWHVSRELLETYANSTLDMSAALSVETHVERCAACRALLPPPAVDPPDSWLLIERRVLAPRRTRTERVLASAGVPAPLARLVVGTPSLSRAWVLGLVTVLALSLAAARLLHTGHIGVWLFLAVAPVLPVAAVAGTYGPRVDPACEVLAATPRADGRLQLVRAIAVLGCAAVPTALVGLALPGPWLPAATWLLPGLGLSSLCLWLSVRLTPLFSAAWTTAAWVFVLTLCALWPHAGALAPFGAAAQGCWAVLAVTALAAWTRTMRATR
ncbi:zf-HC2 domain-containing protein [Streptomyces sp. NPDC004111]|uniref:zf-HC2 domain-containing protein n=1 Tax=Streptomyces sp. NPDC004111 TaxID=3364690 RepID=UPI003677EBFC